MRELILQRIDIIKYIENVFSKSSLKWNNFSCDIIKTHISDMDFSECNDRELLVLFERIVKRYNSL